VEKRLVLHFFECVCL